MSDETKKLVLARRARFVAAAVAGIALSCGKDDAPRACLSIAAPPWDASLPPADASADAATDAEVGADGGTITDAAADARHDGGRTTHPSLKKHRPGPCLIVDSRDDELGPDPQIFDKGPDEGLR